MCVTRPFRGCLKGCVERRGERGGLRRYLKGVEENERVVAIGKHTKNNYLIFDITNPFLLLLLLLLLWLLLLLLLLCFPARRICVGIIGIGRTRGRSRSNRHHLG